MASSKIAFNGVNNNFHTSSPITINNGTTLTQAGLLSFKCYAKQAWAYAEIRINKAVIGIAQDNGSGTGDTFNGTVRVNVGDLITWGNANNGVTYATLTPYRT